MINSQTDKILAAIAAATRKTGLSDRMGTVAEVMQKGGEQKIRCEIGVDPDGKPLLSPWMNPTSHHSGASSEQKQFKKGQNVRLSAPDGNYRQATVTHAAESTQHAPQPKNAPQHGYGNSYQVGGKLFGGYWSPDESEQGSGGQGGGQGGGNGGQGAGGGEEKHRHETWIAKDDQKPQKYSGKSQIMGGGNGQGGSQQGQQGEQKKLEEEVMVSTDEKNGWTARVKKDKVRLAAHEKGGMMEAGKTFFAAHMDKDAVMKSQGDAFVTSDKNVYVSVSDVPYVSKPWRIADKKGANNIPKDNALGNGGTKGGHGKGGQSQVA